MSQPDIKNPEEAKLLKALADDLEAAKEGDKVRALTVEQRLIRRNRLGYVSIPFKDEHGDFTLHMRIPTVEERDRLLRIYDALGKQNSDVEKLTKEAAETLHLIFPEIAYEKFVTGKDLGVDVLEKITRLAMGLESVHTDDLLFFRIE